VWDTCPVFALHCNENSIYVFLFWELRGLSPNFHIHVSVSDLYIPNIGPHISCSRIGRSNVGIYCIKLLGGGGGGAGKNLNNTEAKTPGILPFRCFLVRVFTDFADTEIRIFHIFLFHIRKCQKSPEIPRKSVCKSIRNSAVFRKILWLLLYTF
jgi:hypothetical protein